MEESNSPNKAIIAIVVVVLLLFAAGATIVLTSKPAAQDTSEVASDLPLGSSSTELTQIPDGATFTDGTYSATGSYQTPGGSERIGVKVTLSNGVVSDADLTEMGMTGEAREYQEQFASTYKSQVVGKKISEIKLDRVAGSSLTSSGFNNALNDIAKQAQA